jgi:hypothetical protein
MLQQIVRGLKEQERDWWRPVTFYFYAPVFFVLLATFFILVNNPEISPEIFFRDIATLANVPFYAGFISQLGILLWAASATACFLALYLLKKFNFASPESARFLLQAGLLTTFLMLDDMFLLHEDVAAIYFSIGQKKVYFAYFLIIFAFLFFNRKEILASPFLFLILSMGILGLSMSMDVITDTFHDQLVVSGSFYERYEVVIEDGLKLLGISAWLAYYLVYIQEKFTPLFARFNDKQ